MKNVTIIVSDSGIQACQGAKFRSLQYPSIYHQTPISGLA